MLGYVTDVRSDVRKLEDSARFNIYLAQKFSQMSGKFSRLSARKKKTRKRREKRGVCVALSRIDPLKSSPFYFYRTYPYYSRVIMGSPFGAIIPATFQSSWWCALFYFEAKTELYLA